ncbi:MAG: phage tail protein [Acinetobacter baumannii]|nr:phage tail protein [Acinetobacter baumannii]
MAAQYHSLFTTQGLALLREAIQNGTKLGITHMAYGDGNGIVPTPNADFTKLVKEVYRTPLNRLAPSKENANWLEADGVIPSAVGGFNIREVGLYAGNVLVAYANYPATYKPSADQGTAQIKTIRIVLQIDNTANFELKIDASVVMATIQSVEEAKQDAIQYADENKTQTVNCVSDLNTFDSAWDGRQVSVKGYHEPNFALAQPYLGGGRRIYIASRKNENDGFLCINGWVLVVENNTVTPEQAGAKGDGITDDTIALNKVVNSDYDVSLSAATYVISKPVRKHKRNGKIYGCGELKTIIKKISNEIEGFGTTKVNDKEMNFDVDAVLILMPDTSLGDWYVQANHINGFTLEYDNSLNTRGFGLYVPLICQSTVKNIDIKNCANGVYSVDSWMVTWERVHANADKPFIFGASNTNWASNNTSQTFLSCWASGAKGADSYAWYLKNMQYSTFISCGNDFNGKNGEPINSLIYMKYSDVTFINMGIEFTHAYNLLYAEDSVARFITPNIIGFENRYRRPIKWDTYNAMFNCVSNSKVTIQGGRIQPMYLSTDPIYGESVCAFSMCEGKSIINIDSNIRFEVQNLEESENAPAEFGFLPKFGVYHDAQSGVDLYIKRKHIQRNVYDIVEMSSPIVSSFKSLGIDALNTAFGTVGAYFQSAAANAKYDKNYPEEWCQLSLLNLGQTQLAFSIYDNASGRVYFKNKSWTSEISSWKEFLTTVNTTVDANGFVKKASPIIQLFSDHIESNEEASEQNPVFEKIAVGHYLIKNTLGFATEGWWIEVPSDSNGNKICAIKYQVLENGDIEVKTFKRKFDIETASVVADEAQPIDIPNNINNEQRWIDIRLDEILSDKILGITE